MEETEVKWTPQTLTDIFKKSSDIQVFNHQFDESIQSTVVLIYGEGTIDSSLISRIVLPELHSLYREKEKFVVHKGMMFGSLQLDPLQDKATEETLYQVIFEGSLVIFFPQLNTFFTLNISQIPGRTPEESSTEISIKGPKDGFVESIVVNVALIRKRIRSKSLCYEKYIMGTRTKTKVGLLYFQDIISPKILTEIKRRLDNIDVDGISGVGHLEELLSDSKYSLFPLLDSTGRPDFVVNCLLNGRFVIIIDGNPLVLVGPGTFTLLLKSPEDLHFNFYYVSFVRLIRALSFLLSIILPGLWVALTAFHPDQIPFYLMATVSVARIGLPFTSPVEMFLLIILLEIFREAGVRLPNSIGQTLTVIGGLIIGDASIRAGLVSPSVVVVGAVTAVCGVTLVNQTLSSVVSLVRLGLFVMSSVLGMYGLILGVILLVIYMSRLQTFGIPYLSPLSPPIVKDIAKTVLRFPWIRTTRKPQDLNTIDSDHQGEDPT
ncbi:spore gernimation protein GerA [Paenibacillus macquariensis subsp. macquariensis]|nr:spore gernimation protein GerA [Paenibacillus macquariensis subsp. macquariensis]